MTWFKVDDGLAFHHKAVAAGNAAMGLWVRAGAASSAQLTDGFVHDHMVVAIGTHAQAKRLVDAGLWMRRPGGYQFHDWGQANPFREQVESERAAARDRMQKVRKRSPDVRANNTRTNGEVRDVFNDPDPTRTEQPTVVEEKKEERVRESSRFEEFWTEYPLKKAKVAAKRNWDTLMRRGADAQCIIDGAKAYAAEMRAKDDPKIKYPQGWLTDGRWEDEPEVVEAPARQGMYSAPAAPDDMPRSLFVTWNRAHFEAHQAGKPGPADWHELEHAS